MAKRRAAKKIKPGKLTFIPAVTPGPAAPRDTSQNFCPNCACFNAADSTCRLNGPAAELTGNPTVIWPRVTATDWCAEGWSVAGGWYDQRPITRSF